MALPDPNTLAVFERSLDRCTSDKVFLERFYSIFLRTSDEIAQRFEGVDLERQARVLKVSLYFMCRAASGMTDGVEHLQKIAQSHSKKGYDIKPAFYDHWLESLLAAVSKTDPEFDDDVKSAWVASLRPCIDVMTERWSLE